eukprot:UN09872
MFIEYKSDLGAGLLERKQFINKYRCLRDNKNVTLQCNQKVNCRDMVNQVINSNKQKNVNNEELDPDMKEEKKELSNNAQKRLVKKEKRRLAKLRAKQEKEKEKEKGKLGKKENNKNYKADDDNKDIVKDNDEYTQIKKALQENCGNNWIVFLNNFKNHEVKDSDLDGISIDDLKELIPQSQAMIRFKAWMDSRI